MSQSRFSIVLVGVSALLRRPLVSRLRPADGERSPWVVFAARVGRFDSGFRSVGWPSGSPLRRFRSASSFFRLPLRRFRSAGWPSSLLLPLFGTRRFGVAVRRVGLRVHRFRFSACAASEIALGELAFGLIASEIAIWRVGLWAHCFRFSARAASEIPLGGLALPPSVSELPFGGLAFGLTASAFRHAPLRSGLGGLVLPLGGLVFGLTASAFRHAPLRSCRWASSFFRLPFRSCRSAGWPSGSLLPLFGTRRFAPPHRRSEDRRSTTTRHLFHFKTLIPTC